MAIDVTNLLQGAGTLYRGDYQATEPANSAINSAPAASAWTDLGGTTDGLTLEIGREYSPLAVDQIVDTPDRRQTSRELTFATNLAEMTLENLVRVANESVTTNITSSGNNKVYEPDDNPIIPVYCALIFDGYAPSNRRRRIIGRRMLSIDPIQFAYKKDSQAVYTAKWAGHYVSSTVRPYKIVDQIS